MARRDGTGPLGHGPMTGKGFGRCYNANAYVPGRGFGGRFGYSRGLRIGFQRGGRSNPGFGVGRRLGWDTPQTRQEFLKSQKELLENQLESIKEELEQLDD